MRALIGLTTLASTLAFSLWACGGDEASTPPQDAGGNDGSSSNDGGLLDTSTDTSTPCTTNDLRCKKVSCGAGVTTNLSGTVYDPAGKRTLYNVIVYVPNKTPSAITNGGPTCDKCGTVSGDPIVAALTDANGNFTLKDVPAGTSIPLVIQTGKWRRQVTIPAVTACADNSIGDRNLTRLPRKASEGDMPTVAIASACDPIECSLRKFGVDDAEFSTAAGTGHVRIYAENAMGEQKVNGVATTAATTLWTTAELAKYDILVNSCECGAPVDKGSAAYAAVATFLDTGGRMLGNHRAVDFFGAPRGPAELQAAAAWNAAPSTNNSPDYVDQGFPKGKAFAGWLTANLGGPAGQMAITTVRDVGDVKLATSRYLYETTQPDAGGGVAAKYLSFQTPTVTADGGTVPAASQCGRAGFAEFHTSAFVGGGPGGTFPDTCTQSATALSDEEYAFEFTFFELGSCVQDETMAPAPPAAVP